jgi:hypothetical protein
MAARSFHSADLYAGSIVLGVIGFATNFALERVERHVLRWCGMERVEELRRLPRTPFPSPIARRRRA